HEQREQRPARGIVTPRGFGRWQRLRRGGRGLRHVREELLGRTFYAAAPARATPAVSQQNRHTGGAWLCHGERHCLDILEPASPHACGLAARCCGAISPTTLGERFVRLTVTDIHKLRAAGEKIVMLTAYDASFAALADAAGVELLLVGDSLGMVVQGHDSTLPVTLEQMVYHTSLVARGAKRAIVIADMPFGTYQESPAQALRNAVPLLAAGAHMVKLEGGRMMAETVRFLVERGVAVCGHVGLTPQSVHTLGGYRVQGRSDIAAESLLADARAIQD